MPPKVAVPRPRWSLIDIGINLTDGMYLGAYHGSDKHAPDIDDVLRRAAAVGVRGLIITGGNLEESRAAIELAVKCNSTVGKEVGVKCFATVGCHPTRCNEFAKDPEAYGKALRELIAQHRVDGKCADQERNVVCAVGECGLDYDREHFCKRDVQLPFFVEQIKIAEETKLPMFLHNRNTGTDFLDIMREHRRRISHGIVHSFTGDAAEMHALASLDLYIGVNGCSMKTDENLDVIRQIPLEKLLLETDGPWCEIRNTHASAKLLTALSNTLLDQFPTCKKEKFAPGAIVKGRNEPAHMVQVLDVVLELRKDEVAERTPKGGDAAEWLAAFVARNTDIAFGIGGKW